ncbi:MAG: hypothetical protein ACOC32_01785 [Nanoarchaeota archaeon]
MRQRIVSTDIAYAVVEALKENNLDKPVVKHVEAKQVPRSWDYDVKSYSVGEDVFRITGIGPEDRFSALQFRLRRNDGQYAIDDLDIHLVGEHKPGFRAYNDDHHIDEFSKRHYRAAEHLAKELGCKEIRTVPVMTDYRSGVLEDLGFEKQGLRWYKSL